MASWLNPCINSNIIFVITNPNPNQNLKLEVLIILYCKVLNLFIKVLLKRIIIVFLNKKKKKN